MNPDHDALGQIVEDCGLQLKRFPTDDGVRQGEFQEEGLEDGQLNRRSQTETFGGQAERLSLPCGDGVRNRERNSCGSSVSEERTTGSINEGGRRGKQIGAKWL